MKKLISLEQLIETECMRRLAQSIFPLDEQLGLMAWEKKVFAKYRYTPNHKYHVRSFSLMELLGVLESIGIFLNEQT